MIVCMRETEQWKMNQLLEMWLVLERVRSGPSSGMLTGWPSSTTTPPPRSAIFTATSVLLVLQWGHLRLRQALMNVLGNGAPIPGPSSPTAATPSSASQRWTGLAPNKLVRTCRATWSRSSQRKKILSFTERLLAFRCFPGSDSTTYKRKATGFGLVAKRQPSLIGSLGSLALTALDKTPLKGKTVQDIILQVQSSGMTILVQGKRGQSVNIEDF